MDHDKGTSGASAADSDDDKWLQLRYTSAHSDIQWAKGQSWSGLQWTIVLIAAIYWASTNYSHVARWVWPLFVGLATLVSVWWQIDLHYYTKRTRAAAKVLEAGLDKRHPEVMVNRVFDRDHLGLLLARLVVIVSAAAATVVQLVG